MRTIKFHGQSLGAVRGFPLSVKRNVGYQLHRIQCGLDPVDWKPMQQIGTGVKELRVRDNGQFRVIFFAVFNSSVHVLHAFQKKTRRTRLLDMRIASEAFRKLRK